MITTPRENAIGAVNPAPTDDKKRIRRPMRTSLAAHGEPMIWLAGGGLAIALAMIAGLLLLVLGLGGSTFWPKPVGRWTIDGGAVVIGESERVERFTPTEAEKAALSPAARARAERLMREGGGTIERRLVRIGNFELTNEHYRWISAAEIESEDRPEWAMVAERMEWGRFYGIPQSYEIDGVAVASDPVSAWKKFSERHAAIRARFQERHALETGEIGAIERRRKEAVFAAREAELSAPADAPGRKAAAAHAAEESAACDAAIAKVQERIERLNQENDRDTMTFSVLGDRTTTLKTVDIVRLYPANRLEKSEKLGVYFSRWGEFLAGDPREVNTEGGVFPAILGTVLMTLVMSVLVVPFGVLAALYLREYAKAGPAITAIRIAVNNLAGVPSIVYGVFGLGFFCYILGGSIDQLFFKAALPNPTYGTGGLLWASLTLSLLTLPVVIVSVEEALAAVPNSMREGSYACGASKWQTIRRIVLPRAMPGIMTGMILAIARGAGEVAPLMLVGVLKNAPAPVDGVFPYVHLDQSFMHLGFYIFDLGFQSPNAEAAKPMVFTTTLLLIAIIAILNVAAVLVRSQLRKKFTAAQF